MAQPDADTQSLIRRLTVATKNGTVSWNAVENGRFLLNTGDAVVEVRAKDADDDHPFLVSVKNRDGLILGQGRTVAGEGYAKWETEIADLYRAARNSGLGIKATYDNLASQLDLPPDPDDIPF